MDRSIPVALLPLRLEVSTATAGEFRVRWFPDQIAVRPSASKDITHAFTAESDMPPLAGAMVSLYALSSNSIPHFLGAGATIPPTLRMRPNEPWLTSYPEAINQGMALTILDPVKRCAAGTAEWLIAIALPAAARADVNLVQELIESYRGKHLFSLIRQDFATNSTAGEPTAITILKTETTEQETAPIDDPESDRALFERTLRLHKVISAARDPATLEHRQAQAMNSLLWFALAPSSFGATVSSRELLDLFPHFRQHVSARGICPAFRIGKVPYGVLPLTNLATFDPAGSAPLLFTKTRGLTHKQALLDVYSKKSIQNISESDRFLHNVQTTSTPCGFSCTVDGIPGIGPIVNDALFTGEVRGAIALINESDVRAASDRETMSPAESALKGDDVITDASSLFLRLVTRATNLLAEIGRQGGHRELVAAAAAAALQLKKDVQFLSLQHLSTNLLKTLFLETFDLFSARTDTWITSLAAQRLFAERNRTLSPQDILVPGKERVFSESLYTGCYGIIRNRWATGTSSGTTYFQAPSLDRAITGAVIKGASELHGGGAFATRLPSVITRHAAEILQRMRNNEPLELILGAKLERLLNETKLWHLIEPLRKAFPYTQERPMASRIINGELFAGDADWKERLDPELFNPFVIQELTAVRDMVCRIADGVADLVTAETVFDMVRANGARSSAWLLASEGGTSMPTPEFVTFTRSGTVKSQKVLQPFSPPAVGTHDELAAYIDPAVYQFTNRHLPLAAMGTISITSKKSFKTISFDCDCVAALHLSAADIVFGGQAAIESRIRLYLLTMLYGQATILDRKLAKLVHFDPASFTISHLDNHCGLSFTFTNNDVAGKASSIRDFFRKVSPLKPESFPVVTTVTESEQLVYCKGTVADLVSRIRALVNGPLVRLIEEIGFCRKPSDSPAPLYRCIVALGRSGITDHSTCEELMRAALSGDKHRTEPIVTILMKKLELLRESLDGAITAPVSMNGSWRYDTTQSVFIAATTPAGYGDSPALQILLLQSLAERLSCALTTIGWHEAMRHFPHCHLPVSFATAVPGISANTIAVLGRVGKVRTALRHFLAIADSATPLHSLFGTTQRFKQALVDAINKKIAEDAAANKPTVTLADCMAQPLEGTDLPADFHIVGSAEIVFPANTPIAGWVIDEWSLLHPNEEENTQLVFEQPAKISLPPHLVLLAVAPECRASGVWQAAELATIVSDAIDLIKLRTVTAEDCAVHDPSGPLQPLSFTAYDLGIADLKAIGA